MRSGDEHNEDALCVAPVTYTAPLYASVQKSPLVSLSQLGIFVTSSDYTTHWSKCPGPGSAPR